MKFNLSKSLLATKKASFRLGRLSSAEKNQVLAEIAGKVKENKEVIIKENKKDIRKAKNLGFDKAFIDRLTISDRAFEQIEQIINLPDPVGQILEKRTLTNGVVLQKVSVPLGVIGIIYESRPNVTLDAVVLALKAGNAIVLKGGSEAVFSNRAIVKSIHQALEKTRLPKEVVLFLDNADRRMVYQVLKAKDLIDVIIPRGSSGLVKAVAEKSSLPLLCHAAGGARIYIDSSANIGLAVRVCVNAKTNRPATCNSLDTVIVHEKIAKDFLKRLSMALGPSKVNLRADKKAGKIIAARKATKKDFETEFLNLTLAIKIVKDAKEATDFINQHSKKHSEGIIASDKKVIKQLVQNIDSAAIFVNCSTRLHDGGVFEMGAEMGIATGKLHARGPVGLQELTTYKWIAYGNGQIRERISYYDKDQNSHRWS